MCSFDVAHVGVSVADTHRMLLLFLLKSSSHTVAPPSSQV
jgi:hypothetical protein